VRIKLKFRTTKKIDRAMAAVHLWGQVSLRREEENHFKKNQLWMRPAGRLPRPVLSVLYITSREKLQGHRDPYRDLLR
jgi:hypothetical protein